MNIIETTFEKLPTKCLLIGFEGENLRATVRIDCASVFAEYPNATPALIVKPLFADAYPVVVDRNGTDVDWLITSEILSFNGDGEIQLVFYKDQVICKSAVSKIRVSRSLQATGEKPDPIARWEDAANQKLAEVDAVIVSIDEMDATAHGLPEGSAPTAEVQTVDDHKRISLGIPVGATGATGAKGDKGDRGEVGATPQMGIGQVSTLPAGSAATASMSGTTENPLLNLGIPRGIQGVKGDRGEKGDTGATGATGATPDFSIGTVSTLPAGSSATAEITGTAENPVLSLGIPQGVQGEKGEKGDPGDGTPVGGLTDQVLAKASDTDYDTEWIHVAPMIKNTASGAIASFPDGADGHLVDELKVSIEPVQAGTGDPSPDNVRPITGWTATKVTRTGKNLFDVNALLANRPSYTINFDGSVTILGNDGMAWSNITGTMPIKAGIYTLSRSGNIGLCDIRFGYENYATGHVMSAGDTTKILTIAHDTTIKFKADYSAGSYPVTDHFQLELSSTATDYEPYAGNTYSITLPTEAGTVYSGELTINADGSGSLAVDMVEVDMGSIDWILQTGNNIKWFAKNMGIVNNPIKSSASALNYTKVYLSCYKYAGYGYTASIANCTCITNGNVVYIRDDSHDTANAFITAVDGQQMVYELATPITYNLTALEITTLLGENNVWADAGGVAVKYDADTKLYIDNKITQAIAAALNS